AYMEAISKVEQSIIEVNSKIEANVDTIETPFVASSGVTPTAEHSYTDENELKSTNAKNTYDGIKDDVEDLNDDQLKLAALRLDADGAEGKKLDKINKGIDKLESEVVEQELKLAPTFATINLDEKRDLIEGINESKALIKNTDADGTPEMVKHQDDIDGAEKAFQEAKVLRNEAADTEDDTTKNDLLKQAAAIEDGALTQLQHVADDLGEIADKIPVAANMSIDEVPVDETLPVKPEEGGSLSDVSIYESVGAQHSLEPVLDELNEIAAYDAEIDELNNQKEGASEKDIKKIDKKITKAEGKVAKIELKIAPEIAAANDAEFTKNQNVTEEAKNDFNQISSVGGTNSALLDGYNFEKTASDQFLEAEAIRLDAASIKDKTDKNNALKKADGLEKAAIKNMEAANALYAVAAKNAAQQKYPRIGAEVPENVDERASTQQQNMALQLAGDADDMLKEAQMLEDSSVNLKNDEARNLLLSEADELRAMGIMKRDLSDVLLYSSDDLAEDEARILEDKVLLDGLTNTKAQDALQTPEYKVVYDQFVLEMEEIENDILGVETLQNALRSGAETDRGDAADLLQNAELTSDPIEKEDFINRSNEALKKAREKEAEVDSLQNLVESLVEKKGNVRAGQNTHLSSLPNQSLAKIIEAISISDLNKEPIAPVYRFDSTTLASSTFEVPEVVVQDIVVIGNPNGAPTYNDENPIPLNPKMPEGLVYRVQVGAFRRPIPQDLFKGFAPITGEKIRDDITRYRVGYFVGFQSANEAKNEIRALGYKDAFVVAIYQGKYKNLSEARRMERDGVPVNPDVAVTGPTRTDPDPTRTDPDPTRADPDPTRTDPDPTRTDPDPIRTDPDPIVVRTDYYDSLKDAPDAQPIEVVQGLFYTVQIGAYSKEVNAARDLYNIQPLNVKLAPNGLLRYSTGRYRDIPSASKRKNEVRAIGISDAFLTVYYNGERISFGEARRLIEEQGEAVYAVSQNGTTRILPSATSNGVEGLEYIVDLGTFHGGVPSAIARAILPHGNLINREFRDSSTLIMTSGPLKTFSDADSRKKLFVKDGVSNASIRAVYKGKEISVAEAKALEGGSSSVAPSVNTTPKAITGLFFRVHLGNYSEAVPVDKSLVFMEKQVETAPVESVEESNGSRTYFCGKSKYLAEAEENQRIFVTSGITDAKVIAFYNGAEITLEEAIKMTLE
ncbi:MAG: hypothetical protein JKY54_15050, partial [Flavobacteriales bacterium]|nr:hypothetical protein [Flavobacteriales bacterium]